ncbi:MFS transporter [Actinokineospora sp. PR83]|uniref:MFS transporter n=1 Tax=Actinokineospora sp. PR83 TaxID=2884908 RepID=UPI001F1DF14F|nr:MFS transporter [Actinokineospora sp. PR83]MCG8914451.1 MFS transporter [Actinokineospora sp. PR83]
MSTTTGSPSRLRSVRDFRLLWGGAAASMLGERVAAAGYPLLVVFQGGSPATAGLVGFFALLPVLLLQLPAGVYVDRWDRRQVLLVCDVLGALALGSVAVALAVGELWLPHLLVAAFAEGAVAVFYRLAERAAVRSVVPSALLPAALSRNEARGRAAGLLGQPLGGLLFTSARWAPFAFTAVAHLTALATLLCLRRPLRAEGAGTRRGLRAELGEGLRWLRGQRFLATAVLLVAGTNVLFQVLSLALVLIVRGEGGSAVVVGVIGAASGLGGVLGALAGSAVTTRFPPGRVLIAVFAVWSAVMPVIALVSHPVALGALYAALSFAGALLNVLAGAYQVSLTPDALQGRVGAVAGLLSSGAGSLGALLGGLVLAAVGTTAAVLGASAVMLCLTATAAALPAVRSAGVGGAR